MADIKADPTLKNADILCLQETFCQEIPILPGYTGYLAGEGRGRGVAAYVRNNLVDKKRLIKVERLEGFEFFQGLKLHFHDLHILNIYRSPDPAFIKDLPQFVQLLKRNISPEQQTMICGDFNYDYWKEPNHKIAVMLKGMGFNQIVREPTTIKGKCIDHVYLKTKFCYKHHLYYPYYTDHECVCTMLKKRVTMD